MTRACWVAGSPPGRPGWARLLLCSDARHDQPRAPHRVTRRQLHARKRRAAAHELRQAGALPELRPGRGGLHGALGAG
eukprot:CAMPEP_0202888618 /NCGR_PEP_ID=MMETSP1391-20130828/43281_1 /ASSEMBLY_ACC=CAM_ASM_000867 /TAXON_ID=1034604 /ORGANISM="Chlamydomonas leiostraca, Strain SAG 11-49" /LENGTH=77 /DNA_ID=CAMNT_0049571923 /DNA_START=1262 /DNA_END=1491 /DNA_ORIENTATION=+